MSPGRRSPGGKDGVRSDLRRIQPECGTAAQGANVNPGPGPYFTVREIAAALGAGARGVQIRAAQEGWPYVEQSGRGGPRGYRLGCLPVEVGAAVARAGAAKTAPLLGRAEKTSFEYDARGLWKGWMTRTARQREIGLFRAGVIREAEALARDEGLPFLKAAKAVAARTDGVRWRRIRDWHYGSKGRPGARLYAPEDRPAALAPGHAGGTRRAAIPPQAWDFFCAHWLDRSRPSVADSYRRTREAAAANGWGELPSLRTFRRRALSDIAVEVRILKREGARALARAYPPQRRDKRSLRAGEFVSGDGLKFDSLWVDWGNGDIINTSTAWFWQDVRTGYIMAHRIAQTETMDLIRLTTYDLTGICLPKVVQIDNTMAAANKAMTAGMKGRKRFKDRPGDPEGLLKTIGVEKVQWTNPDRITGNPGAKPVERSFGPGGIHEMVRTNPRFHGRGYSRKTAVPIDEFREVVADEVARFNAQEGRRSPICNGKSLEQAFREDFEDPAREVRVLAPEQRELLKRVPAAVTPSPGAGEISIRLAPGELGRLRYWSKDLARHRGRKLTAYYDPENLKAPVTVLDPDGRLACVAEHLGDVAFNDAAAAKEHARNKRRHVKAAKAAAKAQKRMTSLQAAALSPKPEGAEPPEAGVAAPNFRQQVRVASGDVVAPPPVEEYTEEQRRFDERIIAMGDREIGFREGVGGWSRP